MAIIMPEYKTNALSCCEGSSIKNFYKKDKAGNQGAILNSSYKQNIFSLI